jgi:hypothetical protein
MMRFLSWLSAIFWIGLGIVFMLRTQRMAEGLSFTSPDGLTGLRAIVAGLHIAIGAVILVFTLPVLKDSACSVTQLHGSLQPKRQH